MSMLLVGVAVGVLAFLMLSGLALVRFLIRKRGFIEQHSQQAASISTFLKENLLGQTLFGIVIGVLSAVVYSALSGR